MSHRFLENKSWVFYYRTLVSRVFILIRIRRQAQDELFGEQFYISSCYHGDNGSCPASYTDQLISV